MGRQCGSWRPPEASGLSAESPSLPGSLRPAPQPEEAVLESSPSQLGHTTHGECHTLTPRSTSGSHNHLSEALRGSEAALGKTSSRQ